MLTGKSTAITAIVVRKDSFRVARAPNAETPSLYEGGIEEIHLEKSVFVEAPLLEAHKIHEATILVARTQEAIRLTPAALTQETNRRLPVWYELKGLPAVLQTLHLISKQVGHDDIKPFTKLASPDFFAEFARRQERKQQNKAEAKLRKEKWLQEQQALEKRRQKELEAHFTSMLEVLDQTLIPTLKEKATLGMAYNAGHGGFLLIGNQELFKKIQHALQAALGHRYFAANIDFSHHWLSLSDWKFHIGKLPSFEKYRNGFNLPETCPFKAITILVKPEHSIFQPTVKALLEKINNAVPNMLTEYQFALLGQMKEECRVKERYVQSLQDKRRTEPAQSGYDWGA